MNDYINIIFKGKYEFEEDTLQPFKNIEQYLEDFEEINDWKYLVIHHGLYQ